MAASPPTVRSLRSNLSSTSYEGEYDDHVLEANRLISRQCLRNEASDRVKKPSNQDKAEYAANCAQGQTFLGSLLKHEPIADARRGPNRQLGRRFSMLARRTLDKLAHAISSTVRAATARKRKVRCCENVRTSNSGKT